MQTGGNPDCGLNHPMANANGRDRHVINHCGVQTAAASLPATNYYRKNRRPVYNIEPSSYLTLFLSPSLSLTTSTVEVVR